MAAQAIDRQTWCKEREKEQAVSIVLDNWAAGTALVDAVKIAKDTILSAREKPEHDSTPWEKPPFDVEATRRRMGEGFA